MPENEIKIDISLIIIWVLFLKNVPNKIFTGDMRPKAKSNNCELFQIYEFIRHLQK